MLLEEIVEAGAPVCFYGIQCRIASLSSEHRLRLTLLPEDGDVRIPPLYLQDICWMQTRESMFWCVGEVVERYHSENQYIAELEIKSGLYEMKNHTAPVRPCSYEAMLSVCKSKWYPVTVSAVSTAGAFLEASECSIPEAGQKDTDLYAVLKIEGMHLKGVLLPLEYGETQAYEFKLTDCEMQLRRRFTESIVFAEEQGNSAAKKHEKRKNL